jgi:HPt (histidine-containing phosphotransfer) domain-containing protein
MVGWKGCNFLGYEALIRDESAGGAAVWREGLGFDCQGEQGERDVAEDHLDFDALAIRAGFDRGMIVKLFEVFLDTSESDLAQLRSAVAEDDPARVVEAAHSIKGAAMSLGLVHLSRMALEIEYVARSGTVQGVAERLPALASRLQEIARLDRGAGSEQRQR